MMPDPAPTAAQDFLEHLHEGCDGWFNLFAVDRTTGDKHIRWSQHPDRLADHAAKLADRCCVWYGVASRRENLGKLRGGAADCLHIPGLWVDIDIDGPHHAAPGLPPTLDAGRQLLTDYPLPPTVTINTGGGLQALWLFHEPIDTATARTLLARWGATWIELGRRRGWHVDNVFDVSRVLRLPGTSNRKTAAATPVTIEHADWTRRYNPDDLDEHTVEPPQPPASEPARPSSPYIGPERPGDAYNLNPNPTPEQLLLEAGFHSPKRMPNGDITLWAPHRNRTDTSGATIYADDGHTTIYSETFAATRQLEPRRPYDPFGLYAALRHGGDWTAATSALRTAGYGSDHTWTDLSDLIAPPATQQPADELPPAGSDDDLLALLVNWGEFWAVDHTLEDWLIQPVIAAGRSHALFAPGGTGKSLLSLWIAVQAATGGNAFTGSPSPPRRVLYLDYEMTNSDLAERLESMGYGPDHNLDNLKYALLPPIAALDQPEGGRQVIRLAELVDAELVIIDTFGRAVHGDENEADTVRAWYRWTGLHLKHAGRAFLRVDHAGKDLEKGQRGTSAKNDDVDIVWQLTRRDEGNLTLKARKRRMGWVPETVELQLADEPLRYRTTTAVGWPAGTGATAADLDTLGLPLDVSARQAAAALRTAGRQARNEIVRAAVKYRRERAGGVEQLLVGRPPRPPAPPLHPAVEAVIAAAPYGPKSAPRLSGRAPDENDRGAVRGAVGEDPTKPQVDPAPRDLGRGGRGGPGVPRPKCAPLRGAHGGPPDSEPAIDLFENPQLDA